MLNLKKTAVAVLAFGSSAVFAGTMGPVCAPGNVTVPCASQAWDFGAQALYLKPSYSAYQYAFPLTTATVPTGGTLSTATATNVNYNANNNVNNWGWGFKIDGSYHFSTGNDVNVNWYHLDHTTNNSGLNVPTLILNGSVNYAVDSYAANGTSKWDAVNVEFGQHAHFGEWKNIRFHGGVEYAHLQANANIAVNGAIISGVNFPNAIYGTQFTSKYNGFGPRVGADYLYNWGNGFAMYANGASALLVGTQSFNNAVGSPYATIGTTSTLNAIDINSSNGSATAVVPELEAKLGVKYTYAMAQGDLSLDAGWMWVNYFNGLNAGPSGTSSNYDSASALVTNQSNFAVQGPFVGLKWVGNVA